MFTVRHLTAEQVEQLFAPWIAQAEARALEAWVNVNLNPGNKVMKADFEQAAANLAWLEAEKGRCL